MAGGMRLTDTVELVYCVDVRSDRFWLDAAVLLRGTLPGWPLSRELAPPWPKPAPFGPGGGSSPGRHNIFIASRDRALWIDRSFRLPLNGFNVVALDHADDPVNLPIVREMFTINSDLGAAPSDPLLISFTFKDAAQQLRRSLEESARVQAFLHP
jgi:hypothetical protein